jgi:hypothetical protein
MKHASLLRKQLLLLGVATLIFFSIGLLGLLITSHLPNSPALFLARIMDRLKNDHGIPFERSLEMVRDARTPAFPLEIDLIDFDTAKKLVEDDGPLPTKPLEV